MAFEPGKSGNSSGRPKGAKSKVGVTLRETITKFLEDNFKQVSIDFLELSPKDRAKLYTDLLQFGLPRLQATTVTNEFEKLTDEQLDQIISELKKTVYD